MTDEFNPYRLFTGAFLPNWLVRRAEISQGAKLCYARLCQYAGKDGRCYPSRETLAERLGTSKRQVDRYIKELVQCKLIRRKRRGLRKTNVYSFVWHKWIEEGLRTDPQLPSEATYTSGLEATYVSRKDISSKENQGNNTNVLFTDSDGIAEKASMKEKVKNKAKKRAPKKKKKNQKPPYENKPNLHLFQIWNQQDNLRTHNSMTSKVYKESLRKLEMLRQGTLYKIASGSIMLRGDIPEDWYHQKWKKTDISKAIRNLNEWCKEGNYPKSKDWIGKLSLSDAIFNSRTGSPLMQAFKIGVQPLFDPYKILETGEEQMAYEYFRGFFIRLGKEDTRTQKQIVDLVRQLKGKRERFARNWQRYDPEYFGYGRPPCTVNALALDYTEFLKGNYPSSDFKPKATLTPNGLKLGTFVWNKFCEAYEERYGANAVSGPN